MMAPAPTKRVKDVHPNREQKGTGHTNATHSADTIKEKRINTLDEYVSKDGDYHSV